jgi:molybdopterin adenylyltransferase
MAINVGILTISDRSARGERVDLSGPVLTEAVEKQGWNTVRSAIVADEIIEISKILIYWSDQPEVNLILTTGGTGFSARDVTPEATLAVIERLTPGIPEAMRASSLLVTPHAMLSRSVAGIRKQTLIINLPGSPKAAIENLQVILPVISHAIQLIKGDAQAEKGHYNLTKDLQS